ncbi:hypothetical protein EV189_0438 [Motilibacter rhizosphaerae]|uniref:DUF1508 domain-containing protein n=1 Tax=Motilibacter rhizosphaerae TaxID=598652 RepID=A0A4Q7NVN5_9ACTN|nr:hypothetical protein [Motilibacter rhizosphaerae]RZS91204.1 hypothetical protein EV189_0438 [Motilibacter rhizosphaerae]
MTSAARFHFFSRRASVAPGVEWRLLAGNNRELGRAALPSVDLEACRRAVGRLLRELPGGTATVIPTEGRWTWRLVSAAGEPLACAPHSYARRTEATSALSGFRAAAPAAVLLEPDAPVRATVDLRMAGRPAVRTET